MRNGGVSALFLTLPRRNSRCTQLILYWYGVPHPETGLNLATCIWQSRAHAIGAMSRPNHVRAMRLAAASYAQYDLARYRLVKRRGTRTLSVEPYDRGDAGW